jgi:hypothetical protein
MADGLLPQKVQGVSSNRGMPLASSCQRPSPDKESLAVRQWIVFLFKHGEMGLMSLVTLTTKTTRHDSQS